MKTNETCNGKDVNENIQENSKGDFEDTTNQEMTESNPAFLKYLQFKVKGLFHCPLTVINKSSCIIEDSLLDSVLETCWSLLLGSQSDTVGCCAAVLVVASVRTPQVTSSLLTRDLHDTNP